MGIIYCATSRTTEKMYIGKTMKPLEERVNTHYRNRNDGTYFHKAICNYGIKDFYFTVIDQAETNKELSYLECLYIDMFSTCIRDVGYNTTHGGDGVILNAEGRKKMSESKKGKPSPLKGKHYTGKALKNMRASRKDIWVKNKHPMLGKTHTEESIKKISNSKKGKKIGYREYNKICIKCGKDFKCASSAGKYCKDCNPYPYYNKRRKI